MTTYTTIPNSSLEPGKPIRSIDGIALRDNLVSVLEGDATAPRLIGRSAKNLNSYSATVTAADTYEASVGSNLESLTTTTASTANPPTVVAARYTITAFTGAMRFKAAHYAPITGGATSRLSIYKNNTLVQEFTTGSTSVARAVDISVADNDVIEWRHSTSNASYQSNVTDIGVFASDAWTTRQLYILQSEINRA